MLSVVVVSLVKLKLNEMELFVSKHHLDSIPNNKTRIVKKVKIVNINVY